MIEQFFPKVCDNIKECDVIKDACLKYVEPIMLQIIQIMKADSHLQTMTPQMLREMSSMVFGPNNGITTNGEFLDRINGDSNYTEYEFKTDFDAWKKDERTVYKFYKDDVAGVDADYPEGVWRSIIPEHTFQYGATDNSPMSSNNYMEIILYGEDIHIDPDTGIFDAEVFFDSISYKFPINIDVDFVIQLDTLNAANFNFSIHPVVCMEVFADIRR